jgi:hypothetical protein
MWAAAAADLEAQNDPAIILPARPACAEDHAGSFETMHKVRDGDFWD